MADGNSSEPRVWARGLPETYTPIDESVEYRRLILDSRLMFLAVFGICVIVYLALNVVAAKVTWLWYPLVYIPLGYVSWLFGERVADFFEVKRGGYIVASVAAIATWIFLCIDGTGAGLPTGQIASFMVESLDFPEEAVAVGNVGAVATSVFRALTVGVLPIAGISTLWVLRGRVGEEISDRHHANPSIKRLEMQLNYKRERDEERSELEDALDHAENERDKALKEVERIRKYPPIQLLRISIDDSTPGVRRIDDSESFIRFVIGILDEERSPARRAWVGEEAKSKYGATISKANWGEFSTILFQRRWLENKVKADVALSEFGLSREGYKWEEAESEQ